MDRIEELAAAMLCIGFEGATLDDRARTMLSRGVRSVILFTRNYESPAQLAELCRDIRGAAARPVLITIDQEGGRVQRLREPFTIIPSMREIGRRNDPEQVIRLGAAMARELRAVGIDMNLAPVLDVDSNPANPVIGERSFGADPRRVAALGVAMIEGLRQGGLTACGKHFPGHGDTSVDSHLDLPRLSHTMERLERVELVPFEAAIKAGVEAIMSSHVIFEPLDAKFPATLSRAVLHGILRERMSFKGLIVSDDMEMGAIAKHYGFEEAIRRGVEAGIDLFMVCAKPELQLMALETLQGVPAERLRESVARLDALIRSRHPGPIC